MPAACVAVVVAAIGAGYAWGAGQASAKWEARYEKRERALVEAKDAAEGRLRDVQSEITRATAELRSARANRVLCIPEGAATNPAAVPSDRADAGLVGDGNLPAPRDLGPALRECLAVHQRVSTYESLRNKP